MLYHQPFTLRLKCITHIRLPLSVGLIVLLVLLPRSATSLPQLYPAYIRTALLGTVQDVCTCTSTVPASSFFNRLPRAPHQFLLASEGTSMTFTVIIRENWGDSTLFDLGPRSYLVPARFAEFEAEGGRSRLLSIRKLLQSLRRKVEDLVSSPFASYFHNLGSYHGTSYQFRHYSGDNVRTTLLSRSPFSFCRKGMPRTLIFPRHWSKTHTSKNWCWSLPLFGPGRGSSFTQK